MNQNLIVDRTEFTLSQAEVVIGLEVHVQLKTQSKLFCGCSTEFGASPNTQTCPVCTGMPGSLPVLNSKAIQLAIKTGLALNCEIASYTKWDRKNYFYPDLPKGYQTSQYDLPICKGGHLDISDPKSTFDPCRVRLERAHLEEDAGKSLHDESGQGRASKIDLNRAGTPLLEIVTKPDLRSAEQAKAFLQELRLILTYIEVSDCNMQEGSLRCDANVNLRMEHQGETIATPIAEIKNLNSFRAVERAIQAEAKRQFVLWQETGLTIQDAPKQTRGWNDQANATFLQRDKEESADYRYFPCPDLLAYRTTDSEIETIRDSIVRLPSELRADLISEYGLKAYDADVIVSQGRGVVAFFFDLCQRMIALSSAANPGDSTNLKAPLESPILPQQEARQETQQSAQLKAQQEKAQQESQQRVGKLAANWIGQEVLRHLNEHQLTIDQYPVSVAELALLLEKIRTGDLDSTRAKDVLAVMLEQAVSVEVAIDRLGIVGVSGDEIDQLAETLIAENEDVVSQLQNGNAKAIGALIGKAKQQNANANPSLVREAILKQLGL